MTNRQQLVLVLFGIVTALTVMALAGQRRFDGPLLVNLGQDHGVHLGDFIPVAFGWVAWPPAYVWGSTTTRPRCRATYRAVSGRRLSHEESLRHRKRKRKPVPEGRPCVAPPSHRQQHLSYCGDPRRGVQRVRAT